MSLTSRIGRPISTSKLVDKSKSGTMTAISTIITGPSSRISVYPGLKIGRQDKI